MNRSVGISESTDTYLLNIDVDKLGAACDLTMTLRSGLDEVRSSTLALT